MILKYGIRMPLYGIIIIFFSGRRYIQRIIDKIIYLIYKTNFSDNKRVWVDYLVQIEEKMYNCKCKFHRGKSTENRTDYFCIVIMTDNITRVLKKQYTINEERPSYNIFISGYNK